LWIKIVRAHNREIAYNYQTINVVCRRTYLLFQAQIPMNFATGRKKVKSNVKAPYTLG